MAISALAVIIFLVIAARGDSQVVGSGSSGNGTLIMVSMKISRYCLVPIISGALGILFWAWPSRKPPKLSN